MKSSHSRLPLGFLGCLALLLANTVSLPWVNAAPPDRMSFQGYLMDANGLPLGAASPANFEVRFRIFAAESGGAALWEEQQSVTVDNGHFSVLLGEGTMVDSNPPPAMGTLFQGVGSGERFVEVAVAFQQGGAFNPILPRLRLLSSPYSFLSSQALSIVDSDGTALVTTSGSTVSVGGPVVATSFSGNGSSLLSLNASNMSSGNLADARLSPNVALRNATQTFTGGNTFTGSSSFSGAATLTGLTTITNGRLNNENLWFRSGATDFNHGVGYYGGTKNFNGFAPDGPVMFGHGGGGLGTSNGARALRWDTTANVILDYTGSRLSFGARLGQHMNLFNQDYGLGIQNSTLYFRSGSAFGWYRAGSHHDSQFNPGGGSLLMKVDHWGNLESTGWMKGTSIQATGNYLYYGPDNRQGFLAHVAGSGATQGGGRRIVLGGTGSEGGRMNNGTNQASYDGDSNWDFFSDVRLKENIQDAEPLLSRLLEVKLRRYHYRDRDSDKLHLGVIAQELQPLFPDFVSEGPIEEGGDPLLMVAYTDFGLIAMGGVQELAAIQRAETENLRAENEELKRRIELLEARVGLLLDAISSTGTSP
jgi:hypothetical protein